MRQESHLQIMRYIKKVRIRILMIPLLEKSINHQILQVKWKKSKVWEETLGCKGLPYPQDITRGASN
jgi:hypothetical protein